MVNMHNSLPIWYFYLFLFYENCQVSVKAIIQRPTKADSNIRIYYEQTLKQLPTCTTKYMNFINPHALVCSILTALIYYNSLAIGSLSL